MMLARLTLYLFAAGLLCFGALFLVAPTSLTTLVQVSLPTSSASTEVRGAYGGLSIGTALFFLSCARRRSWLRPGIVALVLISGGLTVGRILGLLIDGPAIPSIYVLIAAEGAVFVMGLIGWRKLDGEDPG
ncbi:MAG TPA: DUF4345 family protein [Longimicrobiaceae bacterium]|nr:DUF4345 family protein [Longimicrobiaceae bacterium]